MQRIGQEKTDKHLAARVLAQELRATETVIRGRAAARLAEDHELIAAIEPMAIVKRCFREQNPVPLLALLRIVGRMKISPFVGSLAYAHLLQHGESTIRRAARDEVNKLPLSEKRLILPFVDIFVGRRVPEREREEMAHFANDTDQAMSAKVWEARRNFYRSERLQRDDLELQIRLDFQPHPSMSEAAGLVTRAFLSPHERVRSFGLQALAARVRDMPLEIARLIAASALLMANHQLTESLASLIVALGLHPARKLREDVVFMLEAINCPTLEEELRRERCIAELRPRAKVSDRMFSFLQRGCQGEGDWGAVIAALSAVHRSLALEQRNDLFERWCGAPDLRTLTRGGIAALRYLRPEPHQLLENVVPKLFPDHGSRCNRGALLMYLASRVARCDREQRRSFAGAFVYLVVSSPERHIRFCAATALDSVGSVVWERQELLQQAFERRADLTVQRQLLKVLRDAPRPRGFVLAPDFEHALNELVARFCRFRVRYPFGKKIAQVLARKMLS